MNAAQNLHGFRTLVTMIRLISDKLPRSFLPHDPTPSTRALWITYPYKPEICSVHVWNIFGIITKNVAAISSYGSKAVHDSEVQRLLRQRD